MEALRFLGREVASQELSGFLSFDFLQLTKAELIHLMLVLGLLLSVRGDTVGSTPSTRLFLRGPEPFRVSQLSHPWSSESLEFALIFPPELKPVIIEIGPKTSAGLSRELPTPCLERETSI